MLRVNGWNKVEALIHWLEKLGVVTGSALDKKVNAAPASTRFDERSPIFPTFDQTGESQANDFFVWGVLDQTDGSPSLIQGSDFQLAVENLAELASVDVVVPNV